MPPLRWKEGEDAANIRSLIQVSVDPLPIISRNSETPDSTSAPEPSELVKASPYLMSLLKVGLPLRQLEWRAQASEHLREALCSIPWYAKGAKADPDFWIKFHASRINWWPKGVPFIEPSTNQPVVQEKLPDSTPPARVP
jgi:hypothetical protein